MKKLFTLLVLALFGCAGAEGEDADLLVESRHEGGSEVADSIDWENDAVDTPSSIGAEDFPVPEEAPIDKAAGSRILKYYGIRHGTGSSSTNTMCWGVSTAHICDVPSNKTFKYTVKIPNTVTMTAPYQRLLEGVEQAWADVAGLSSNNFVFSKTSGSLAIELRVYEDSTSGEYGAANGEIINSNYKDNIPDPITGPSGAPQYGIHSTKLSWIRFNLYAMRALAQTCFGTNYTDAELRLVGYVMGLHEGGHGIGLGHPTVNDPRQDIMSGGLACTAFASGSSGLTYSLAQMTAITQYVGTNWENTQVLTSPVMNH